MDFIDLIGFIILFALAGVLFAEADKEVQKEIDIIKNTQEYVTYKSCHYLDEEWYCYNEK